MLVPLTVGRANGDGKLVAKNGDCISEPPADIGVDAVEMVDGGLVNEGTGGICTLSSGDLCFNGVAEEMEVGLG